jgi:hypothetical protein
MQDVESSVTIGCSCDKTQEVCEKLRSMTTQADGARRRVEQLEAQLLEALNADTRMSPVDVRANALSSAILCLMLSNEYFKSDSDIRNDIDLHKLLEGCRRINGRRI